MTIKLISIAIFFFEHYHLEVANSKYIIQTDFDIPFDIPNYNHNVSSTLPHHKAHTSVNRKFDSRNGIGPRSKVQKTKSRSLTG